jgi:hypothetical protein
MGMSVIDTPFCAARTFTMCQRRPAPEVVVDAAAAARQWLAYLFRLAGVSPTGHTSA